MPFPGWVMGGNGTRDRACGINLVPAHGGSVTMRQWARDSIDNAPANRIAGRL
jgi:hypothetical protein